MIDPVQVGELPNGSCSLVALLCACSWERLGNVHCVVRYLLGNDWEPGDEQKAAFEIKESEFTGAYSLLRHGGGAPAPNGVGEQLKPFTELRLCLNELLNPGTYEERTVIYTCNFVPPNSFAYRLQHARIPLVPGGGGYLKVATPMQRVLHVPNKTINEAISCTGGVTVNRLEKYPGMHEGALVFIRISKPTQDLEGLPSSRLLAGDPLSQY
ncbi:hypothetical protein V8E53_001356 [Lactarius tabidus]